MRQEPGEVSEHVTVHRSHMVGHEPTAQEGDRYDRVVAVPPIRAARK